MTTQEILEAARAARSALIGQVSHFLDALCHGADAFR